MSGANWDPAQYLRFGSERLRPALDLMAQIPLPTPAHVVDLGCGAGNVTAILAQRWPQADILGVDGSEPMLARAREAAPGCRFQAADIAAFAPEQLPAVIFSNAALQWLPDHSSLFPRLFSLLAPGGFMAVQMPAMDAAPFRALQHEVAREGPWAAALAGVGRVQPIPEPAAYWDLLKPRAATLQLWETIYLHALTGPDAVLQWAMGTSLRPYLAALEEPARSAFRDAYAAALRPHYPERPDGITFLPFRRLFMVAGARA
jgi:trans-aconitate 2-methyltransferase